MVDKQDLILLNICKAETITAINLTKVMGYQSTTTVTKDLKVLLAQGFIEELDWSNCPHCGEKLDGIEVKKTSISLKLTDEGIKRVEGIKKVLKDLL